MVEAKFLTTVFLAAVLLAPSAALAGPAGLGKAEVDAAVARGRDWLLAREKAEGRFACRWDEAYPGGGDALAVLALLRAGVPAEDPLIRRAFERLIAGKPAKTYTVSLCILALDAAWGPPPEDAGRFDPKRPGYAAEHFRRAAPKAAQAWLAALTEQLARTQGEGWWRYPEGDEGDLSNTQLALLALRTSAELGAKLPDAVWFKPLERLLASQQAGGEEVQPFTIPLLPDAPEGPWRARGWGYHAGEGPRGSMTAGAVGCLAILRARLIKEPAWRKEYGPRVDRAMADGFAWLARNFSVAGHPGANDDWWDYWAYSLERSCALAGVEGLGAFDWYALLGRRILDEQKPDGSWYFETEWTTGRLAGTCLAILFLKRATVPIAQPRPTGSVEAPGPRWERLESGRYRVSFRFADGAGLESITLAGSMNGWDAEATPLARGEDRVWLIDLELPPGRQLYKFVINGKQWRHDPGNSRAEPDGHGGLNSVLVLE